MADLLLELKQAGVSQAVLKKLKGNKAALEVFDHYEVKKSFKKKKSKGKKKKAMKKKKFDFNFFQAQIFIEKH